MTNLAFEAMRFARHAHRDQVRKYTGQPYADHLAEVAGIVAATVIGAHKSIAVAWLHDCVEDQGVDYGLLGLTFGRAVADGVMLLSDLETGNRAERKAKSRVRLAAAPGWVQTIKVADLISNTSSIVKHDPKFAVIYLEEKRLLLDVLTNADAGLLDLAREQLSDGWQQMVDPDGTVTARIASMCGVPPLTRCAAGRDGDCSHIECPQGRDDEPRASGRHCPLDVGCER